MSTCFGAYVVYMASVFGMDNNNKVNILWLESKQWQQIGELSGYVLATSNRLYAEEIPCESEEMAGASWNL